MIKKGNKNENENKIEKLSLTYPQVNAYTSPA